ncbi:unnamed protein product, partial [Medioppia subpectinata]
PSLMVPPPHLAPPDYEEATKSCAPPDYETATKSNEFKFVPNITTNPSIPPTPPPPPMDTTSQQSTQLSNTAPNASIPESSVA